MKILNNKTNILYLSFTLAFFVLSCDNKQLSPSDLLLTEDNTSPSESLESKNRRLPFFGIELKEFYVIDENSNGDGATAEDNARARIITATSKKRMLDALDIIRFVINTPEFEKEMLSSSTKFRSARTTTGPLGDSINKNDFYDNKKVFQTLQNVKYKVTIRKGQIPLGAAAVGVVANQHLYVYPADNEFYKRENMWIAFPNRENWDSSGYLQTAYIASVILHEIVHNMGYTHGASSDDTVYGIQDIFLKVYNDKEWQEKYKAQLKQFTPYYSVLHENEVAFDTKAGSTRNQVGINAQVIENNLEYACQLNVDGTYNIIKNK